MAKKEFVQIPRAKLVSIRQVRTLYKPPARSHKGENGIVLIVGGSKQYHGAPLFCAKIAGKIVDLVYFSSTPENNELLQKMKSALADFIAVPRRRVGEIAVKADVILIGPGMGISRETEKITDGLLKKFPDKKFVLDADALKVVDKRLLNKNCVVTPHHGEFKVLFGTDGNKETVFKMAKKYDCVVVLKGPESYVSDGRTLLVNKTGNAGMTKGGTGDVLAGLIAALACKNDLLLAASAGLFVNGLAGDRLKREVFYYYSVSDLIEKIPKALKWCETSVTKSQSTMKVRK